MKILVDADACPNVIKDILFRASKRLSMNMILFANHPLTIPKTPFIKFVQVSKGFDVADDEIIKMVLPGDLVITADIPLADSVIDKHATAINPRGMLYTKENIKQKLTMRNFMEELRSTGAITGGPASLNKQDLQQFANALDQYLTKHK
jgi:uncharacterized protein YaiI (UPF0178 family)